MNEALNYYYQALNTFKDFPLAHHALGQVCEKQGASLTSAKGGLGPGTGRGPSWLANVTCTVCRRKRPSGELQ